ncbi:hypothetical protein BLNAU_20784 [Blattamonas nauphoetae]|uniref:Uncharacterized protein n=1 Tax=Blattamonas nauphoetae TaxID=2049346 RepID=A0ABQ9WXP7_9EUKA|nr:hypothetical protein BLNAU_20784 [Blattamonas nauphoetae]
MLYQHFHSNSFFPVFESPESSYENAALFRSLVATVKSQPALDVSLETTVLTFLEAVTPHRQESADAFLTNFLQSSSNNTLTDFVQSINVLISSSSQFLAAAAMEMLKGLLFCCSAKICLTLVEADLVPQLILSLNPLSLSFEEAADIHIHLNSSIYQLLWLSTQIGLAAVRIEDRNEQQAVHETVFQQVLVPSEKYICHLCANRYSIIDGRQSEYFLELLTRVLRICPYYQPTMEIVLHMPVFLTIPSCLTFFESDRSIWYFLSEMVDTQREWNKTMGDQRQMGKMVHRMLRMEGIEDVIEEKLQNDKTGIYGGLIVDKSIEWNNLLGMNLPEDE